MEMIAYALEYEAEQSAWDIWTAIYPGFTQDTFVPFLEFKTSQLKSKPNQTQKAWHDIEVEMAAIVNNFETEKRGEPK